MSSMDNRSVVKLIQPNTCAQMSPHCTYTLPLSFLQHPGLICKYTSIMNRTKGSHTTKDVKNGQFLEWKCADQKPHTCLSVCHCQVGAVLSVELLIKISFQNSLWLCVCQFCSCAIFSLGLSLFLKFPLPLCLCLLNHAVQPS